MRQRNRWYQTVALGYLTAAVLLLALPPADRLALWLPLHLVVAGAVAVAISGAMQVFARTLTATPEPGAGLAWTQFAAVTGGAAAIALGRPMGWPWLVALGGLAWTGAIALLGRIVWRAWRRSLTRRHPVPIGAYGAAVAFGLLGGLAGAVLGAGRLSAGSYVALRFAHPTAMVLGFASLTIVGTMVTLLPTVLRVRMLAWRGASVVVLLATGVALQLAGWTFDLAWMVGAGGLVVAAGAVAFAVLVVRTATTARRWAPPTAALHLLCGVAWFTLGSVWWASMLVRGAAAVDRARGAFLAVFVLGWLVQILVGAWAYLLPTLRPGGPERHRAWLRVFEAGGRTQVVAFNVAVALLAAGAGGGVGAVARAGWVLGLATLAVAIARTWAFPVVAGRLPTGNRGPAVWG